MTDLLTTARTNVATRMRQQAAAIEKAAASIEAGEDDGGWAMKHELRKLEGEAPKP